MAGIVNEILYGNNIDFSGAAIPTGQFTANGQLLIGSSVAPNVRVGLLNSSDGSITFFPGNGTLDITGTPANTSQIGSVILATSPQTVTGTSTTLVTTPSGVSAKLGVQTAHGLMIGEGATSALNATSAGLLNQIIMSQGATTDPNWSTAAYPPTAGTSGNVITSDGTNFVSQALPAPPGTTLTNHSVALGTGTANLSSVGPSALPGAVLQSTGASTDPAFSSAAYPVSTTINQLLYSSAANAVVGLATANDGLLVTSNSGVPSILPGPGTTGNMLQSNAAAAPSFSTASYPSTAGTSGNVITSNGTNFVSQALPAPPGTTLTNHSVALGTGTANLSSVGPSALSGSILQSTGASTDPAFSSAAYPVSTTINQLLYSSAANTVGGLATVNNAALTTNASGVPTWVSLATNGQLIIGSGSGAPAAGVITSTDGTVTVTNGANTIDLSAKATWIDQGTSLNPATVGRGYRATATITITLPNTPADGSMIAFQVDTTSLLTVTAGASDKIRLGNAINASAGGSITNKLQGDTVTLVYRLADNTWIALSYIGSWTIA
jgi:trimeric autotransporter adhesin